MKKQSLFIASLCIHFSLFAQLNKGNKQEVLKLIERVSPETKVQIKEIPSSNGCDVFEQEVKGNKLILKGSSPVAVTRGFYDFLRNNELGQFSWTGSRISWPQSLEGLKTRRIQSPVKHHYYYNVVTYGYSMPYWDWNRWEQEIDWMALHGIDMPLALVANEAISVRVWRKLGLTEDEIAAYLVGPAHFPWMRMGNISGIDSPLPQAWHEDQVALQHQILKRMRTLGMKPICPGFAGFVPQAIQRLYPDLKLIETSWSSFHNWMVSPQEELFSKIGKMFIEEWEKEFGKNTYYLVDSFNEMEIPFPAKGTLERYELLSSYGDKVYNSIKAGNPDAIWVMQGWMFGYQRYIWDYETLQALVSPVPDDKMLLLDLAVDYNANFWKSTFNWEFYKGFFNKSWVYSVIPNMGGKSGLTGILDFYANGHLEALSSPNRGKLDAIGLAPEGIENNEVLYELFTDASWSSEKIDVNEWLKSYSKARYGVYNLDIESYWQNLLKSVYGSFTDHPRFNWQFRPGTVQRGSIALSPAYFEAFERFAQCAPEMEGNKLYEADLRENLAMYLGGKLEILVQAISKAYLNNETENYDRLVSEFERIALTMDRLLEDHPTLTLNRWLDFARNHGNTPELKAYYERNARRIVTVWGPPVDDYSARIWSGLIRDYYLPRWLEYFKSQQNGNPYQIAALELDWVEKLPAISSVESIRNVCREASSIIASTRKISFEMINQKEITLLGWSEADFEQQNCILKGAVSVEQLKRMKGLRFSLSGNTETIHIEEISLSADGTVVYQDKPEHGVLEGDKKHYFHTVALPERISGNNGCELKIRLKRSGKSENLRGQVVLLTND